MGTELAGVLKGSGGAKMKADVGEDTVVFRGGWKGEVPFEEITAEARGTLLVLSFRGQVVEVGAGARSSQLASKIRSPPSRLDRLGIEFGVRAALAGSFDAAFRSELGTRAVVEAGAPKQPVGVLFFACDAVQGLEALTKLAHLVAPGGSLWVVHAEEKLSQAQLSAGAKSAGLKWSASTRFGDGRVASRFVKP